MERQLGLDLGSGTTEHRNATTIDYPVTSTLISGLFSLSHGRDRHDDGDRCGSNGLPQTCCGSVVGVVISRNLGLEELRKTISNT